MSYLKQIVIVFFAGLLFCTVGLIQANYRMIALENNQLYTQAVTQKNNNPQLLEVVSEPTNFFQTLGPDIRAFHSSDYARLNFPIYEGTLFAEANTLEALVGSGVPTQQIAGKEYVEFAGTDYLVIGKLGRSAESNLYTSLLINDSRFFAVADSVITIDTNFTSPLFQLFGQQTNNFGTRDGSSAFFITVNWFAFLIFITGLGVVTLLFHRQFQRENQILFLSGFNKSALLKQNLLKILLSIGGTFVLINIGSAPFLGQQIRSELLIFSVIFLVSTLVAYTLTATRLEGQTYGVLS